MSTHIPIRRPKPPGTAERSLTASTDTDNLIADVLGIGMFAKAYDRDLVDAVLAETGRREQRVRMLPAHLVVYLVLGLSLYANESYSEVVGRMASGLQHLRGGRRTAAIPTVGAITAARTRLGAEPLVALFNRAATHLAKPDNPNTFSAGLRVVGIHRVTLNVADSPANAREFGYPQVDGKPLQSALPQVTVVTLTEAGTHATIGAAVGPRCADVHELTDQMATTYLRPGMLATAPAEFYSPETWATARATGAELLWAVDDAVDLPVVTPLADGTYISQLPPPMSAPEQPPQVVRVLECSSKSHKSCALFRVISSQICPRAAPAKRILATIDMAPETTQAFIGLDSRHLPNARPLRSRTPELVLQEVWAQMLSHYAIRSFITGAADNIGELADTPAADPDISLISVTKQ